MELVSDNVVSSVVFWMLVAMFQMDACSMDICTSRISSGMMAAATLVCVRMPPLDTSLVVRGESDIRVDLLITFLFLCLMCLS